MGTNTTQASNVAMLKNLPYDPAKDFTPILRTVTTAMVLLVNPNFPAKDLAQFMAYAKTHPNMTGRLRLRRVADLERATAERAAAYRSSRRPIAACRWPSPT